MADLPPGLSYGPYGFVTGSITNPIGPNPAWHQLDQVAKVAAMFAGNMQKKREEKIAQADESFNMQLKRWYDQGMPESGKQELLNSEALSYIEKHQPMKADGYKTMIETGEESLYAKAQREWQQWMKGMVVPGQETPNPLLPGPIPFGPMGGPQAFQMLDPGEQTALFAGPDMTGKNGLNPAIVGVKPPMGPQHLPKIVNMIDAIKSGQYTEQEIELMLQGVKLKPTEQQVISNAMRERGLDQGAERLEQGWASLEERRKARLQRERMGGSGGGRGAATKVPRLLQKSFDEAYQKLLIDIDTNPRAPAVKESLLALEAEVPDLIDQALKEGYTRGEATRMIERSIKGLLQRSEGAGGQ